MALNRAFVKCYHKRFLSATEADKEPPLGFSFQVDVASKFFRVLGHRGIKTTLLKTFKKGM